ncbi:MAG: hypothetical protein OXB84_08720, partial [Halobacteriovoraceae bacterium]|nr:hypothetical protein [Halobacteriovoraceae bacterium]
MLLPITDSTSGKRSFLVFEKLESYLKESDWCYYHSNAGLIDILGNYRTMQAHLRNSLVLRKLAEKTQAGSLIRIDLSTVANGVHVQMTVIADNGRDIYFNKKNIVEKTSPEIIARTIKNWLRSYEETIPYNGRVIGILGNQFTVDMGKFAGAWPGARVSIKRPIKKQVHPHLKKVVGWKTLPIAEGKIFHVEGAQFQGKITHYEARRRLKLRDWASVKEPSQEDIKGGFAEITPYKFSKLGFLNISLDMGTGSAAIPMGSVPEIDAFLIGTLISTEIWVSRHFWSSLHFGRKWGVYSPKEESESFFSSASMGITKIKLGYRYLPLGFFNGPRADAYLGFARYSYGVNNRADAGYSDAVLKGLLMGFKGMLPVHKKIQISLLLDFIISPN